MATFEGGIDEPVGGTASNNPIADLARAVESLARKVEQIVDQQEQMFETQTEILEKIDNLSTPGVDYGIED